MRRKFYATMSYELAPTTPPDARKLLRAELVGRSWQDRVTTSLLPSSTVWCNRFLRDDETTDDLHAACVRDLREAAEAVLAKGLPIALSRAWVHVSGAGTLNLAPAEALALREPKSNG